MKYIRTKDGRIFQYGGREKTLYGDIISISGEHFRYDCVLKEADTIEELCDEFVCASSFCCSLLNAQERQDLTRFRKSNLFGAIWTDKGLIYVAKMNEKGELELL